MVELVARRGKIKEVYRCASFDGPARYLGVYIPENMYISSLRNSLYSKELGIYISGQPVSCEASARPVALPVELNFSDSYTGRAAKQAIALLVELNSWDSSTKTQAVELSSSTVLEPENSIFEERIGRKQGDKQSDIGE